MEIFRDFGQMASFEIAAQSLKDKKQFCSVF